MDINHLKPSLQYQKAANKAHPHLEYCIQVWSPWLEQDKNELK